MRGPLLTPHAQCALAPVTMLVVPLPIFTEHLVLRPYRPEDVAELHAVVYGDHEAMRLLGGARDLAGTRAAVERSMNQQELDGYSFWAVIERESGLMAGEAGLFPLAEDRRDIALGYALGVSFWGRGYATEAGRAVLDEAFGPLGLERVVAITRATNFRSRRVLSKLGFSPQGLRHVWGAEQLYYELGR
ncbi:MAG: GNAT family N-acetyltransferase [Actinomycetota bacterium]|nr:GNAT family N-acetyltransferase [Actinomycetota bacterium]